MIQRWNSFRPWTGVVAVLDRWAPYVEIPRQWLTAKERSDAIRSGTELLAHYRRASAETRDALLRIARAV